MVEDGVFVFASSTLVEPSEPDPPKQSSIGTIETPGARWRCWERRRDQFFRVAQKEIVMGSSEKDAPAAKNIRQPFKRQPSAARVVAQLRNAASSQLIKTPV